MNNKIKTDFFSEQRKDLRNWPYTVHQLDDTLDMNLIEGRGKQLLFQGVNTKRLTGFVGSGISMAYGRLSWSDWKKRQLDAAGDLAHAFDTLAKHALDRMEKVIALLHYPLDTNDFDEVVKSTEFSRTQKRLIRRLHKVDPESHISNIERRKRGVDRHNIIGWLKSRERAVRFAREEVAKLHRLFEHADKQDGDFPGGEDAPIQFQIAEQLHKLLRGYASLFVENCEQSSENVRTGVLQSTSNGAPIEAIRNFNEDFQSWVGFVPPPPINPPPTKKNKVKYPGDSGAFVRAYEHYHRIASKPESRLSIEDMAKSLMVDECAHAEHILIEGLRQPNELVDPSNFEKRDRDSRDKLRVTLNIHDDRYLSRNIPGIRQNPNRFKVLAPFKISYLMKELETLQNSLSTLPAWSAELKELHNYLQVYQKKTDDDSAGNRTILTPTSRFLVGVIMRLVKPSVSLNSIETSMISGVTPADFTSRRSIIAERLDPLPKLVDGLNIQRYMTLNYDFEIERYFQDIGFRNFAADDDDTHADGVGRMSQNDFRYDGVGAATRDLAFERDDASDLISFSAGRDGATYGVYHLHGRATDSGRLVVNERDYMDLYLKEDENRETVDEAIKLAFAANPLVFLGLGMNEADLLRPLRQFASNRDHNMGYNAIALVPAENSFTRRAKFSSGLYIRYGVHTIFYGSGIVKIQKDSIPKETINCSVDWLHRILELVKALTKITEARLKDKEFVAGLNPKVKEDPVSGDHKQNNKQWVLNHLMSKTGKLGQDLNQPEIGFEAEQNTLPLLFGKSALTTADFTFCEPEKMRLVSPLFTSTPQDRTPTGTKSASDEYFDGDPYLAFYLRRLSSIIHMTIDDQSDLTSDEGRRDLSARLAMLDGIYGAIITASLNAALDGLQKEHRKWWRDWQQSPPHRSARFERLPFKETHAGFFKPRRHVRHRIKNTITTLIAAENELSKPVKLDSDTNKPPKWIHKPSSFGNPSRTGVRTHDTFIAAVANERLMREQRHERLKHATDSECSEDNGRRIYTIAAHRGLGKGSLMSAMATPKGLSGYIYAAWDHTDKPPMFTDAIFVNLSFSSEIASVYDMVDDALAASIAALQIYHEKCSPDCGMAIPELDVEKGRLYLERFLNLQRWEILVSQKKFVQATRILKKSKLKQTHPKWFKNIESEIPYWLFLNKVMDRKDQISVKNKRLPRLARLELLGKMYRMVSGQVSLLDGGRQPRVFLFISAIDMLFTKRRLGKNKEIEALLTLLTQKSSSGLPFDIIFIGDETGLGWPWITPVHDTKRLEKLAEKVKPANLVQIDRAELPDTARVAIEARVQNSQLEFSKADRGQILSPSQANFVHIARVVNPVNLLIDSFMPLAIIMHVGALWRDADMLRRSRNHLHSLKAYALWDGNAPSRECSDELVNDDNLKKLPNPPPKEVVLEIDQEPISERDMERLMRGSDNLTEKMVSKCRNYLNQIVSTVSPDHTLNNTGRDKGDWEKLVGDVKSGRSDLDQIADLLRLRFRIAGSFDFEQWRNVRRVLGANRFSLTILLAAAQTLALRESKIYEGAQRAERFILEVVDKVRTGSKAKRESLVLSSVLEVYRGLHVVADADHDYELHQLLLRHLAAIGSPTTVGVLVRLPEVRRYLTGLGQALPCSRTKFIGRAMHRLCLRGIVFRLSRHPRLQELQELKKSDTDRPQYRYALHRSVQRHVMSHFGTMSSDVARANEFSPSLFAAMPSGLPRLNHASYRFLRDLMLSLSQYPDIQLHAQDGEDWNFSSARRSTQVQALRAALSMVRSSFSVAVVSRFEDYKDVADAEVRKHGYFETYKVRLRWIIRKAWSLNSDRLTEVAPNGARDYYLPDLEWDEVNALYRDEIVWLYNEVGLVCLVQGNMHDALAHLRQASELNQHIEGRENDGAMGHRISINRAICQMERGHVQAARRRLADVRNDEKTRNKGKIFYLATAHLGVCDHLLGYHESALDKLKKASKYLLEHNDFRASAVIGYHLARLYSVTDLNRANKEILRARRFAEAGGHEDIRRHLDVSEVSMKTDYADASTDVNGQYIEGSKTLLSVIDYAKLMGVPALECEALIVRGRLLLAQNESTAAGSVLTRAMTLAKRNGMNLRLNRAMTLYGSVLIKRRQLYAAERLLFSSLEKAKNSQFRTEVTRIQRLLDQLKAMYSAV